MKIHFTFLFLLSFLFSSAQTTIVLQPDATEGKDAKVFNLDGGANYGTDIEFIASTLNYFDEPGTQRSLLQFDLTQIPNNADIVDARLSLYYNGQSASAGQIGENASYLRRITEDWDENTVNWVDQPFYSIINQVILPKSTSGAQDYENIDVSALIRDMLDNPGHSFGFIFMGVQEAPLSSMKFYTSDATDPAKRPKLEITYTIGTATKEISYQPLSVYPVPFDNAVTLQGLSGIYAISIYDLNGKVVFTTTQPSNGSQITLTGLHSISSGFYVVSATNDDGNYMGRLVK